MASSSSAVAAMDFSDLVQSAEQLTSDCDLNVVSCSSVPHLSSSTSSAGADLPRVQRNLSQLVDAGHQLMAKTARDVGGQEVKAAILLGSKGVDLPAIQQQLLSITSAHAHASSSFAPLEPLRDTDIAGFLRNERENALLSVIEETRRETFDHVEKMHWDAMASEWEGDKRRILQALNTGPLQGQAADLLDITRSVLRAESSRIHDSTLHGGVTRSALDHVEVAFAEEVARYNTSVTAGGGIRPDLVEKFKALFPEEKDQEVAVLWEMVRAMSSDFKRTSAADKWRTTPQISKDTVARARRYLESAFKKFIQTTVYTNLQQAQLGGLPGTFHLVRSFLNVKIPPNAPGLEDGLIDGVPVWGMIYYCLRSGDISAALQAATQAGQGLAEMVKFLGEISSSPESRLTPHSENLVRLSYRRSVRSTTDAFKRAVYCLIGACDPSDEHAEVATSLDDYLWIKLCQIREDGDSAAASGGSSVTETLNLAQLQNLMAEEYGETHFNAYEQPVLYFQVLLLTGQFESAIEFLFRIDRLRSHAVHVALALYEASLLILPSNIQAAMLSSDSGVKRLNVARLVMLYVRKFESTDPKEALNYFYFLRNLRGAKNENLFMSCVSELVLESREFDLLLGHLVQDGSRSPGLIDRLQTSPHDTQKVIETVAADSERKGMFEDSVRLYDLAKKHEKVIELLNKLLAQVISQPSVPESRRDRIQRSSVEVARRYRALGHDAPREDTAAFYLMLDLMTFFDLYHANKLDEALDTVEKIKIIPLRQSDIDVMVSNFRLLPDELRRNVPDLLISCMTTIFNQYKKVKSISGGGGHAAAHVSKTGGRDWQLAEFRDMAKSLITFAGMIPYRMPGDTNARLVQMEVLMN